MKLPSLPHGDLLRDPLYLRLWSSILTSSFGNQVMMLALPLTAAVLLQATPTQMGLLTAVELLPFMLFSLPGGVWLDRVRKLPVYVVGESLVALCAASVPLAWWLNWLTMEWLYAIGFVIGLVHTVAGTAAQIVLTQVVARERLVEAHAKNALATSGAEVAGPGLAGALIKLFGSKSEIRVIGTRHGEKLYESLVSREEMAKAEDLKRYFRVPADNRDLNYAKYFVEGEERIGTVDDYTSHNTEQLDVNGVIKLLQTLPFIQEELRA